MENKIGLRGCNSEIKCSDIEPVKEIKACEVCGDNRFDIIEAAKKQLCRATNIEESPTEWAVIDSFLFRMWQMGWLPGCEQSERIVRCKDCKFRGKFGFCVARKCSVEPDGFCAWGERKDG